MLRSLIDLERYKASASDVARPEEPQFAHYSVRPD
jgi:hypothetical protein